MHIGLIGGIGPAATDYYYRGLIRRHKGAGRTMELTMAHAQIDAVVRNQSAGANEEQAALFATLLGHLKAAGAEIAAVTSLGAHFCIKELTEISPLPLVNIVEAVDQALERRKLPRVGLLGTRLAMESRIYGGVTSAEFVVPQGDDLEAVHEAYIEMAVAGRVTPAQRDLFFAVGDRMVQSQGADAVLLAGTDLFLAFDDHNPGYSVLDSADIHMDAVLARSIAS